MTDAPQYFTVSDDRDAHGWRSVEIHDGRKMSGRAYVTTSWQPAERRSDDDKHVLYLDLGRHLNDENGRTVYRKADPEADEINTGDAIVARPVRVNGIAYTGSIYLERRHDENHPGNKSGRPQPWIVRDGFIHRAGTWGVDDNVTDAARRRIHQLARDLADEIVTDETRAWDVVRNARNQVEWAEREVRKAETELEAARKTAREAIDAYEAISA